MKKIIFTLAFVLVGTFAFANSNVILSNLGKELSTKNIQTYQSNNCLNLKAEYSYVYDNWGVGCYAKIYHNGVVVGTVYAYEFGETQAEATSNCYAVARARAREFIKAAE